MKTTTSLQVGSRVRWAGDESNLPNTATVKALDGAWMYLAWDGETQTRCSPVALLGTARWSIVA